MVGVAGGKWTTERTVAALCMVMALTMMPAAAQWAAGTPKFVEVFAANQEATEEAVISGPYVVEQLNPSKFLIDTDTYQFAPPDADNPEYRMNIMFNPCEGHSYDCCYDVFGTPEYRFEVADIQDKDFGTAVQLFTNGERIDPSASRLPDESIVINEDCVGLLDPEFNCIGFRSLKEAFPIYPVCWDRNDTVDGLGGCRDPTDGHAIEYCAELAFSQNALVVECGNEFANDPHCGTFLEIHKPDDPIILSEVKLRGQFMSGYRQTIIGLNVMGYTQWVLCRGTHELWWVQRTKYNFVIEFKKQFFIETPDCDWDETNDRPFVYAELGGVNVRLALAGTDEEVDPDSQPESLADITLPDPTGGILYYEEEYNKFSSNGNANEPDEWG